MVFCMSWCADFECPGGDVPPCPSRSAESAPSVREVRRYGRAHTGGKKHGRVMTAAGMLPHLLHRQLGDGGRRRRRLRRWLLHSARPPPGNDRSGPADCGGSSTQQHPTARRNRDARGVSGSGGYGRDLGAAARTRGTRRERGVGPRCGLRAAAGPRTVR